MLSIYLEYRLHRRSRAPRVSLGTIWKRMMPGMTRA
jgi:hypothetical protein